MSVRRVLILILTGCLVFGLCACTKTADGETQGKMTYRIKVVDEAGKPMPDVLVQLCKDSCYPGTTDQTGVAQFHLPEADYTAAVTVMPAGYEAEAEEFHFAAGSYEVTIPLKPVA